MSLITPIWLMLLAAHWPTVDGVYSTGPFGCNCLAERYIVVKDRRGYLFSKHNDYTPELVFIVEMGEGWQVQFLGQRSHADVSFQAIVTPMGFYATEATYAKLNIVSSASGLILSYHWPDPKYPLSVP